MKKIKLHKESFKTLLIHNLWLFLLIPIILSSFFILMFDLMDKPKQKEQIRIFSSCRVENVTNQLVSGEYKNELSNYGIIETSISSILEGSVEFSLNFGKTVFDNFEIIIASETIYNNYSDMFDSFCVSLDKNYFNEEFNFLNSKNGEKIVGIKLADLHDDVYNEQFEFSLNFEMYDTTYVFVSNRTENSRRLIDDKHSVSEYSLKTFLELM